MNIEYARQIIAAGFAKGQEMGLAPLTIAVLDAGSHLVALERADGASTLRPQIAIGKAATALALGIDSAAVEQMAKDRPAFVGAVAGIAENGIIPAAGGVLIAGEDGQLLGAVGVTGDLSAKDEACALAGIAAAGLGRPA